MIGAGLNYVKDVDWGGFLTFYPSLKDIQFGLTRDRVIRNFGIRYLQLLAFFQELLCVALKPEIIVTISISAKVMVVNQYPQVAVCT